MKANILRKIMQDSAMVLHSELMPMYKAGLMPVTWEQLERAHQPLGGVCPSCRVQYVDASIFVLAKPPSESINAWHNARCVCTQCANDKGYELLTPDEITSGMPIGIAGDSVVVVRETINTMYERCNHRCVGTPIISIGKRLTGSFDSCVVGYNSCGNLLLQGNDTTAVFSRLGAQCGRCAAICSGRTLSKLGMRDRRYIGVDAKEKYGKFLVYQYVRRIIAERYRWLQGYHTDWYNWNAETISIVRTTPENRALPLEDLHTGLRCSPPLASIPKPGGRSVDVRKLLADLETTRGYVPPIEGTSEGSESDDFSDDI